MRHLPSSLSLRVFALVILSGIPSIMGEDTVASSSERRTIRNLAIRSDGPLLRIEPSELSKLITLSSGGPYRTALARQTILRLNSTGLFHDIQVEVEEAGAREVDVDLVLIRRYLIRQVKFSGQTGIEEDRLRRTVRLQPGDPFDSGRLARGQAELEKLFRREGFFQAQHEMRFRLDERRADLVIDFNIQSGKSAYVWEVRFEANGDVEIEPLEKLLETGRGRRFSRARLERDQRILEEHLRAQGYLRAEVVAKEPEFDPSLNRAVITFEVNPREKTELVFEGEPPRQDVLLETPLFREGSDSPIFLEETASQLTEDLQERGHLLANVEVDRTSPDQIRIRIDPGPRMRLIEIRFEGNGFLGDDTLGSAVAAREAGVFDRGRFTVGTADEDTRRIRFRYQQEGFLDAEAGYRVEPGPRGLTLTYRIQEGPLYRVRGLEILGNRAIGDQELLAEIQSQPGTPFSALRVAQDRADVIATYENLGFRQVDFHSEVTPDEQAQVSIVYYINEGPISSVDQVVLTGNTRTQNDVIRKEIRIEAGEPLSLSRVLATEANLYNLGVFSRVEIDEEPSHIESQSKNLILKLDEAKKYTLLYGIGFSSFEGPRGTLGITDNNFLGAARSLSLSMRAGSRRQRANLSYTIPRLLGRQLPTLLSIGVDNEEASSALTLGDRRAIRRRPFDAFRITGTAQTERRLSRRESLFFRYQFERVELDVPSNLAVPLEFFREEERLRLSRVSASYLNDSRDDNADPRRGFFLSADVMAAPRFLGSQAELVRFFFQGQYYRPVAGRLVWASAFRLGLVTPFGRSNSVPISQRFFSGGSASLRGLPQDLAGPLLRDPKTGEIILVNNQGEPDPDGRPVPLGGNGLIIFNTELRFPIFGFLNGALFYDVGNVLTRLKDLGKTQMSNALGLGLHIRTPIGPIRFDVGYNPSPPPVPGFRQWNFHFTLGHPF